MFVVTHFTFAGLTWIHCGQAVQQSLSRGWSQQIIINGITCLNSGCRRSVQSLVVYLRLCGVQGICVQYPKRNPGNAFETKIKCLEYSECVNASCFWVVQFASGSASTKLLPGPPLGTLAYSKPQSGKGLIGKIVSHSVCIRSGISLWQNIIASISEDFPLMLHLESNV